MAASLPWRGILYAGGLSAVAGFIDAMAYIHLGGYFVSLMSGNTTRASSDLAHGSILGAGLAFGLIGFFSLGVVLSTLAFRNAGARRLPAVLATTTALIAVAALLPSLSAEAAVPPLLAMAMGVVNTSYTRNGEVSIALTYMTGTLVKTGQHFAAALARAEPHGVWLRYFTLWSMISLGAVLGAMSYRLTGLESLWAAAAMLLAWTVVAVRRTRA